MKTNINFLTPIIIVAGIALLSLLSYPYHISALEGFVSIPLYYASAFSTLLISLLLVSMRASNIYSQKITRVIFEILAFTYGIFITMVIAKWILTQELFEWALVLVIATTALLFTVDSAYSGRWVKIHEFLSLKNNEKLRIIAAILGWSATVIFIGVSGYLRASI